MTFNRFRPKITYEKHTSVWTTVLQSLNEPIICITERHSQLNPMPYGMKI